MNLVAISGRESRKHFVDLYMILRGGSTLQDCCEFFPRKYPGGRTNAYHILTSLAHFADADTGPMPRILDSFDWSEGKAFLVQEAKSVVLP